MTLFRRNVLPFFLPLLAAFSVLIGCGPSQPQEGLTVEQRFEAGKLKFDDGDYTEAISEFEILKIQFPGSNLADDAQFYLGECHFAKEEFLLASEEYQTLRRNMPSSPLDTMAQYKIAMCYYNLSPDYQLDQRFTNRAIDEFQAFVEYFPTHPNAPDAAAKIQELNSRKAEKDFASAELYMKLEYYKAATVYFTSVIDRYYDTGFAEPAMEGRIRSLIARKRVADALSDISKYLEKYPSGKFRDELLRLRQDLQNSGPSPDTRTTGK